MLKRLTFITYNICFIIYFTFLGLFLLFMRSEYLLQRKNSLIPSFLRHQMVLNRAATIQQTQNRSRQQKKPDHPIPDPWRKQTYTIGRCVWKMLIILKYKLPFWKCVVSMPNGSWNRKPSIPTFKWWYLYQNFICQIIVTNASLTRVHSRYREIHAFQILITFFMSWRKSF